MFEYTTLTKEVKCAPVVVFWFRYKLFRIKILTNGVNVVSLGHQIAIVSNVHVNFMNIVRPIL